MTLALKRSGLDDAEVAERANLTPAWLSAVKNDRIKNPPLDKLRALAAALDIPLRYFTEPMGVVPIEELPAESARHFIGGRGFKNLTERDLEIIQQQAERLDELNKQAGRS